MRKKRRIPHPALRATLSRGERDSLQVIPSPPGRGWPKGPGEGLCRFITLFGFLVLMSAFITFAQDQPQQQTPFTVRVNTQLVIQAVSVVGKDGKTLTGL